MSSLSRVIDRSIKNNLYIMLASISILTLVFVSTFVPATDAAKPGPKPPTSSGRIAYLATGIGSNFDIYIMNADGTNKVNLTNSAQHELAPTISPDGRKIAFARTTSTTPFWDSDIYTMNADGSNVTRLTFGATDVVGSISSNMPDWSPDGNKIVYRAQGIWTINANGTNQTQLYSSGSAPNWSPNGQKIVFMNYNSANQTDDIYTMSADGSNLVNITNTASTQVLVGPNEGYPAWSADSARITFIAEAPEWPNVGEVYVMNADGSNRQRRTNTIEYNEYHPDWSPDGSKITFTSRRTGYAEIYTMNADGSSQTNITNYGSSAAQLNPQNSSWGVAPGTTTPVNQPPVADFTYKQSRHYMQFTNKSIDPDGDTLTYEWNFGDGQTSNEVSPTHVYSFDFISNNQGLATVTLKATDPSGAYSTATKTITIR